MNLFENLQLMKESDTSIVSEFKEFLSNKNAQYIANEIGETKDGMQIVIYDGDWKHEHMYMKNLINEFFEAKGMNISISSEEIGESDQDTFSARYDIIFNAKPTVYDAEIKPLKFTTEDINVSDWEFIEKTTVKDDIFGDINEGGYYIKKYDNGMTGYIYPPSESEKLYRAKLSHNSKINSLGGFNVFIELDSAKEFLDDLSIKLTPVPYEEIKQQLEEIDTHEFLAIDIDNSPVLNNTKVTITGTLINGEEITFYDSSYLRTQRDIDFIKDQYAKASKEIDSMRNRGYLGVKDESVDDNFDINAGNAATFEDKLEKELYDAATKLMTSRKWGFPEDEVKDYLTISVNIEDEDVKVSIGAELTYSSLEELGDELNKIITKYDKDSYFDMECPGRMVAYLFGYKKESLDKVEETNHDEILDKDYATGEEMYRELENYLNSLDQIAMDGKDCNWEPSEYNAKNLNADGEIYLVSGAYILIYPYVNEWAEDYFKVLVVEASNLSIQLKNGIERIFNKFKTDKWKLVYEG